MVYLKEVYSIVTEKELSYFQKDKIEWKGSKRMKLKFSDVYYGTSRSQPAVESSRSHHFQYKKIPQ